MTAKILSYFVLGLFLTSCVTASETQELNKEPEKVIDLGKDHPDEKVNGEPVYHKKIEGQPEIKSKPDQI